MTCEWKEHAPREWLTACDRLIISNPASTMPQGFKFCPYCGNPLRAVGYQEDDHEA